MSATRQAIEQEINAGEKRLAKIDAILNANHLSKVIEIRKRAHEIMMENDDHATIARLIGPLGKAEKDQLAAFKRQRKNHKRLMDEQLRIHCDLRDLRNNLWRLNLRQVISQ